MGQENKAGQTIIYDSINTQAWLGFTPKKAGAINYKLAKKFKNNKLARAYAFKLANKYKAPIYDKYYGTYIGKYSKSTSTTKPKFKTGTSNWLKKLLPF